jgi:hypothetical protein
MLTTKRKRVPSLHGWAILVLLEEGVIRECVEHGWMRERGDPHARNRAIDLARSDPPAELLDVLASIGDCPPNA